MTAYPAAISRRRRGIPPCSASWAPRSAPKRFAKGVNVLLAPDVNIARVPLNGRTSEAFGEDPYLAGQTAAAYIQGVQSQHVIATVKHFDANDQETNRATIDEVISPRTLAEIYQPAFDAAVNQVGAGAVMCSYNRVNGPYACQNGPLLRRDLDATMGFKGFVVSDWGATHSTVASAVNGLDMEMDLLQEPDALHDVFPLDNTVIEDYYGAPLKSAVLAGQVPMATLDGMVERILRSMFAVGLFDHPAPAEPLSYLAPVDNPANKAVALQAAEAGSVLLKNTNSTLPLTGRHQRIALIGLDAGLGAETVNQAGGSVRVDQLLVSTPLKALLLRAARTDDTVIYYDGVSPALARRRGPHQQRGHRVRRLHRGGGDRPEEPRLQRGRLHRRARRYASPPPPTRTSSSARWPPPTRAPWSSSTPGGPAAMPWLSRVSPVLEMWYPGEEDGNAAAALLFGDVDPSGKLPITFPASLSQLPTRTAAQYPGVMATATYSEGLLVGLPLVRRRAPDAAVPVRLRPLLHHLQAVGLQVTSSGSDVRVAYTITNTGKRAGADVAQVYLGDPGRRGRTAAAAQGLPTLRTQPGAERAGHAHVDRVGVQLLVDENRLVAGRPRHLHHPGRRLVSRRAPDGPGVALNPLEQDDRDLPDALGLLLVLARRAASLASTCPDRRPLVAVERPGLGPRWCRLRPRPSCRDGPPDCGTTAGLPAPHPWNRRRRSRRPPPGRRGG